MVELAALRVRGGSCDGARYIICPYPCSPIIEAFLFTAPQAGLGSEIVLGPIISQTLTKMENGFIAWHYAQLVFSLLLTVAFTANDGIGLFFLPLGCQHVEI